MKKTLSILLTVLLLLGTVAAGLSAAAEGETPDYTVLPLGETVEVSTNETLRFTTGERGNFVLTFDNAEPLTVTLYYESWSFECTKTAQKNLFLSRSAPPDANYDVKLESETEQILHVRVCNEMDYALENADTFVLNEEKAAVVGADRPNAYLEFTAPETAYYTIFARGQSAGYTAVNMPEWTYFASGSFSDSGTSRKKMTAGKTYCFELYSSSDEEQPVTIQIIRTLDLVDPAAIALEIGVSQTLTFSQRDTVQYLKFIPDATDAYTLFDTGLVTDFGVSIYDADFEYIGTTNTTYHPIACDENLTAGQTYYYGITAWTAGTVELMLMTRDAFLAMKSVPIQPNQTLEVAGGDYVAFTPETTGTYVFTARDGDNNGVRTVLYNADRINLNYDYAPGVGTVIRKINAGETYYFVPEKDATCKLVSLETFAQEEGWQVVSENEEINYVGGQDQWCVFRPETTKKYMVCCLNEQWADVRLYDSDFWRINALDLDNDLEKPKDLTAGETYYFRLHHYDENVRSTYSVMTPATFAQRTAQPITLNTPAQTFRTRTNYFAFTPETTESYTVCVTAPAEYNSVLNIGINDAAMKSVSSYYAGSSSITKIATTAVLQAGKTYYFTTDLHYSQYTLETTVMKTADFMTANAVMLTLNTPYSVALESQIDVYFGFIPEVTGNYTITSDVQRYGTLYMYDSASNTIRNTYCSNGINYDTPLEAGRMYSFWYSFGGYTHDIAPFEITISKTCDHLHTEYDLGTAATCTTDGRTVGIRCTDCEKWIVKQDVIPHRHKDPDRDRVCNVCEQPAIEFAAPCNEEGTVTAVLYSDGELIFSGAGAITLAPGKPNEADYADAAAYENAHNKWSSDMSYVQSLVIPEGITSIGADAFHSMYGLRAVTLPKSCTYVDRDAFRSSRDLTALTIYNPDLEINGQFSIPAYLLPDGEGQQEQIVSYGIELRDVLMSAWYLTMFDCDLVGCAGLVFGSDVLNSIDRETAEELARLYFMQFKDEYSLAFGVDPALAEDDDDLADLMLRYVNQCLFTDFTCSADLFTLDLADIDLENMTEETAKQLFSQPTETFRTAVQEKYGLDIGETGALLFEMWYSYVKLGESDTYTPFADVIVRGYAGSTAEAAAAASGVQFKPLCPTDHAHTHEEGETQPTRSAHGHTAGLFCDDCGEPVTAEVIHNQLGRHKDEVPATTEAPGSVKIQCTVCREWGLYEIPQLEPENPGDTTDPGNNNPGDHTDPAENNNSGSGEGDPSPWENFVNTVKKIVRGPVDVILRLIRWIGRLFG